MPWARPKRKRNVVEDSDEKRFCLERGSLIGARSPTSRRRGPEGCESSSRAVPQRASFPSRATRSSGAKAADAIVIESDDDEDDFDDDDDDSDAAAIAPANSQEAEDDVGWQQGPEGKVCRQREPEDIVRIKSQKTSPGIKSQKTSPGIKSQKTSPGIKNQKTSPGSTIQKTPAASKSQFQYPTIVNLFSDVDISDDIWIPSGELDSSDGYGYAAKNQETSPRMKSQKMMSAASENQKSPAGSKIQKTSAGSKIQKTSAGSKGPVSGSDDHRPVFGR